jgi:uncharacterized protein DUF1565
MRSYIILFIILLFSCQIYCDLLIVDIEGNFDFTSIQEAVEAAEDGDEIIVHPGTYYENVDFNGKQLELNSLFATTGERHYIRETIINGNESGSCIRDVSNDSGRSVVKGFTLTNGSGSYYNSYVFYYGGGIYVYDSELDIISCIIKENTAEAGGGISISTNSEVYLSDVIVKENHVNRFGGGIRFNNGFSNIDFDNINRCSIYNNYAPKGADIYSRYEGGNKVVYLDTITVSEYAGYYVFQYDDGIPGYNMSGLTIYYQNTWMELIDSDLYVSPLGDDANSGLSWDEPLKSITWAIQKIAVNPENPHTIFLSEGSFSESNTGEIFPIQCKDCTTIQGVSEETTVIDGEMENSFLRINYGEYNFGLKNLCFANSYSEPFSSVIYNKAINTYPSFTGTYDLRNVIFENNDIYSRILTLDCYNDMNIENVIFRENGIINTPTACRLMLWNSETHHSAYLNNIVSINNNSGKMLIEGRPYIRPDAYISNLVSSNNYHYSVGATGFENYYSLLGLGDGLNCYLINSTLANNTADMTVPTSAAVQTGYYSNINVINSIIYNNEVDYSINSLNTFTGYEVNVHHSLIENGEDGINSILPFSYNDETNLACDPMFSGDEELPLSLHEFSPCIDAGTTQMPAGFTLPETDAAGNPRIMGYGIDMGAYEYNPFGNPISEDEVASSALSYYPNPVRISESRGAVVINYAGLTQVENYRIGIYNIKGQRVRELKMDPSSSSYAVTGNGKFKMNTVRWDCCNTRGDKVAAGVYFLRLSRDGEYLEQGKLTVVK